MSKIIVTRFFAFFSLRSSGRLYKVVVDGQKQGSIFDGDPKEIEVSPGQHSIRATNMFFSTGNTIDFEIKEGETKFFVVQNNPIKVSIVLALIISAFIVIRLLKYNGYLQAGDSLYPLLIILVPGLIVQMVFFRRNSLIILEKN